VGTWLAGAWVRPFIRLAEYVYRPYCRRSNRASGITSEPLIVVTICNMSGPPVRGLAISRMGYPIYHAVTLAAEAIRAISGRIFGGKNTATVDVTILPTYLGSAFSCAVGLSVHVTGVMCSGSTHRVRRLRFAIRGEARDGAGARASLRNAFCSFVFFFYFFCFYRECGAWSSLLELKLPSVRSLRC